MNRRIKKKIETKISKSMFQFDSLGHFVPTANTYREIKSEHKKNHDVSIWLRHMTSQYKGYDAQLKDCRRFRRKYGKAFNEKMKHYGTPVFDKPVFKPYLIGVDMNESSNQKET